MKLIISNVLNSWKNFNCLDLDQCHLDSSAMKIILKLIIVYTSIFLIQSHAIANQVLIQQADLGSKLMTKLSEILRPTKTGELQWDFTATHRVFEQQDKSTNVIYLDKISAHLSFYLDKDLAIELVDSSPTHSGAEADLVKQLPLLKFNTQNKVAFTALYLALKRRPISTPNGTTYKDTPQLMMRVMFFDYQNFNPSLALTRIEEWSQITPEQRDIYLKSARQKYTTCQPTNAIKKPKSHDSNWALPWGFSSTYNFDNTPSKDHQEQPSPIRPEILAFKPLIEPIPFQFFKEVGLVPVQLEAKVENQDTAYRVLQFNLSSIDIEVQWPNLENKEQYPSALASMDLTARYYDEGCNSMQIKPIRAQSQAWLDRPLFVCDSKKENCLINDSSIQTRTQFSLPFEILRGTQGRIENFRR
jgi:hypothetical protein